MKLDTNDSPLELKRFARGILFAVINFLLFGAFVFLFVGDRKLPRKTEEALYSVPLLLVIGGFAYGFRKKQN